MYPMNEGTLAIPAHWRDESLHVFILPDEATNLVVNRTPVATNKAADAVYQETMTQLSAQLPGYDERSAWTLTLDAQPAQALEYVWSSPEGLMHQVVVMQVRNGLLLTFTMTALSALSDGHKAELLSVMETFKATGSEAAHDA